MKRRQGGNRKTGLKFERPEEDDERMDLESDESDSSAMDIDMEENELFESEWEFFPFGEQDWHAVKQHCTHLLDAKSWDVGSVATLITETQRHVGSAIKIGDQSAQALGIGSVLSMRHHAAVPGIKAIRDFTVRHFEGGDRQRVEAILNERSVGLLVNERILNLPPLVALQLHLSIFEELEVAKATKPGGPYDIDYFLLITVAYRESSGDNSGAQQGAKKTREKETQLEWFRPEEEIYAEHAVCSAVWPVQVLDQASRWTFDGRIAQYKAILLIPTSEIPKMAQKFNAINNGEYDE